MHKHFLLFVFLFCVVLSGCGDGTVKSSGTVKFSSGEPVPYGTVFFETPQFSYTGKIQNGTYQIEGVQSGSGLPPGKYNVYVVGTDPVTELSLFDEKFTNPATSGLSFEVKGGQKNIFDFTVAPVTSK